MVIRPTLPDRLFRRFINKQDFEFPPIGDILRRDIWQNPLFHLLNDEEDSNDDEEEEEEEEAEGEE